MKWLLTSLVLWMLRHGWVDVDPLIMWTFGRPSSKIKKGVRYIAKERNSRWCDTYTAIVHLKPFAQRAAVWQWQYDQEVGANNMSGQIDHRQFKAELAEHLARLANPDLLSVSQRFIIGWWLREVLDPRLFPELDEELMEFFF